MIKRLSLVLSIFIVLTAVIACSDTNAENLGAIIDRIADNLNVAEQEVDDAVDSIKIKQEDNKQEINNTNDTTEQTKQTEPETTEPEVYIVYETPRPEFVIYDNQNLGLKIQYPGEWRYIDANISAEEFNQMILDAFGPEAVNLLNEIGDEPSTVTLMWYDFKNASELFVPKANLTISDSEGITQDDLQLPFNLSDLQDSFDGYYALIFDNFQSDGITGQSLGGNYFAIYKFNYLFDYILSLSCYQAMTEKNGLLYMFTFTTYSGSFDAAVYERMLSTLEFY